VTELLLLVYAADVAGAINDVAKFLIAVGCAGIVVCGIVLLANADDNFYKGEARAIRAQYYAGATRFGAVLVVAELILCAVLIVTPAPATLYTIAALRAGEQAIDTDLGRKAVEAINAGLDRVIRQAKETHD
jgi:hypothetical protein